MTVSMNTGVMKRAYPHPTMNRIVSIRATVAVMMTRVIFYPPKGVYLCLCPPKAACPCPTYSGGTPSPVMAFERVRTLHRAIDGTARRLGSHEVVEMVAMDSSDLTIDDFSCQYE